MYEDFKLDQDKVNCEKMKCFLELYIDGVKQTEWMENEPLATQKKI